MKSKTEIKQIIAAVLPLILAVTIFQFWGTPFDHLITDAFTYIQVGLLIVGYFMSLVLIIFSSLFVYRILLERGRKPVAG